MKIINLTPHVIRLNDGTEYPPSGQVARVSTEYETIMGPTECPTLFNITFGTIQGIPTIPEEDTWYVVSAMVLIATKIEEFYTHYRLVAPATGHPACVRKDGQVWSVPGFVV